MARAWADPLPSQGGEAGGEAGEGGGEAGEGGGGGGGLFGAGRRLMSLPRRVRLLCAARGVVDLAVILMHSISSD